MQAGYTENPWGIRIPIYASCVALLAGPLQSRERRRRPKTHRGLGRLYLGVGVLLGGSAGLVVATRAYGGVVAQSGFALMAIFWLYTGGRAYLAIRRGAVQAHQAWMIRNFALTLAAVSLRLYLPIALVFGIPFDRAYPAIAWLCWVPNALLAEWLCRRQSAKSR